MADPKPVISVENLTIAPDFGNGVPKILNGFSVEIYRGQTVALLGESGSGKTLAALSIMGLLPDSIKITEGRISFYEENLLSLSEKQLCQIRGDRIGMIFQEPSTSLNPLLTVGRQIGETLRIHRGLSARVAKEQVIALMEMVGIPDPTKCYNSYPHQLSGGIRQRIVIAMALACRPDLLLADDPTTSLDATIQAQILDLLWRLISDLRMSVLLISHDIGVIASLANRVCVLQAGRIVEDGPSRSVLKTPLHPYTVTLLAAKPQGLTVGSNKLELSRDSSDLKESELMGCRFSPFCKKASEKCMSEDPPFAEVASGHKVRCFHSEDRL